MKEIEVLINAPQIVFEKIRLDSIGGKVVEIDTKRVTEYLIKEGYLPADCDLKIDIVGDASVMSGCLVRALDWTVVLDSFPYFEN